MSNIEGVKYGVVADRLLVLFAYILAIAGAWISIQFFQDEELWMRIAIGDFVATVIIFIASLLFRNSSMYDPYWSVIPVVILLYVFVETLPAHLWRSTLVGIIVVWWAARLTLNWLKTWPGLKHQDWRYIKLAKDTGPMYWVVSFLGIHLFPTVMVFLGCLPILPLVASEAPLGWIDLLGFSISAVAIIIESKADIQLRKFKYGKNHTNQAVCDVGLWRYSRHPNYFGEIAFWGGLFIMAFGLNPSENLVYGVGLFSMIILFVFISIPMMEKRQLQKEGYVVYRKKVSMLVPWFRK